MLNYKYKYKLTSYEWKLREKISVIFYKLLGKMTKVLDVRRFQFRLKVYSALCSM